MYCYWWLRAGSVSCMCTFRVVWWVAERWVAERWVAVVIRMRMQWACMSLCMVSCSGEEEKEERTKNIPSATSVAPHALLLLLSACLRMFFFSFCQCVRVKMQELPRLLFVMCHRFWETTTRVQAAGYTQRLYVCQYVVFCVLCAAFKCV